MNVIIILVPVLLFTFILIFSIILISVRYKKESAPESSKSNNWQVFQPIIEVTAHSISDIIESSMSISTADSSSPVSDLSSVSMDQVKTAKSISPEERSKSFEQENIVTIKSSCSTPPSPSFDQDDRMRRIKLLEDNSDTSSDSSFSSYFQSLRELSDLSNEELMSTDSSGKARPDVKFRKCYNCKYGISPEEDKKLCGECSGTGFVRMDSI